MRLVDLFPRWWISEGSRIGISFACPVHASKGLDERNDARCRLGRVYCKTENVPDYGPTIWTRVGDDFASMSLTPSILYRTIPENHWPQPDEHKCTLEGCCITHWHGFVTNGEVSILADSVPA